MSGKERQSCQEHLGWASALIQASGGQLWPVSALAPTLESTKGPVSTSLALGSTSICQVTYISGLAEVREGKAGGGSRDPDRGTAVLQLKNMANS